MGAGLWFFAAPFDAEDFEANRFGPLILTDRHGEILRRVPSPSGHPGRERWVPLASISPNVINTLLISEDQEFYRHNGIDVPSIARALWLNMTTSKRYGASTLTMQLAKIMYSEGRTRSLWNKIREMRLSLAIERNLTKAEILEHYLNRVYYGRGAYGIESAAQRFFGKSAAQLSIAEASLLVVLPRAPTRYDPIRNLDAAIKRRDYLLGQLLEQDKISSAEYAQAKQEELAIRLHPFVFRAPHFVEWLLEQEQDPEPQGAVVRTTLDLELQEALEIQTTKHVERLSEYGVTHAGVVVFDARNMEILAMVGSSDFNNPNGGQVNIITRKRHPGSALKPFVYATAIEQGDAPSTIAFDAWDVSNTYQSPHEREHGPASYTDAPCRIL